METLWHDLPPQEHVRLALRAAQEVVDGWKRNLDPTPREWLALELAARYLKGCGLQTKVIERQYKMEHEWGNKSLFMLQITNLFQTNLHGDRHWDLAFNRAEDARREGFPWVGDTQVAYALTQYRKWQKQWPTNAMNLEATTLYQRLKERMGPMVESAVLNEATGRSPNRPSKRF